MLAIFGLSSKNAIFRIVSGWITQGIVTKDANGRLAPTPSFFSLPLLGSIKAGSPTATDATEHEYLSLDKYVIGNPDNTYILKVSGDSMIDEGINSGDMVVVDAKRQPTDGDIVVAYVDREWTLKYFKHDKDGVRLVPANPAYSPIFPTDSLQIGGVVVSLVRKYY